MRIDLTDNWTILQDVHDAGERLGLPDDSADLTLVGPQLSEWEPLRRLEHLQIALDSEPYWGRHLRYFNNAPWWYRASFSLPDAHPARVVVHFTNVDYFCRVWLNGVRLGEHEGYSAPFEYDVSEYVRPGENLLVVKVWSPWDRAVRDDDQAERAFRVERDLVKGTYEHSDTLIQRDVNPVGIYGEVFVELHEGPSFDGRPRLVTRIDSEHRGFVRAAGSVRGDASSVRVTVREADSGRVIAVGERPVQDGRFDAAVEVGKPRLWWTWDQGGQPLYEVELSLSGGEAQCRRVGFRDVALVRDAQRTSYRLNEEPLYVRGTSYFPDVYLSTMTRERYLRDLLAIREAGFNLVRVHVHVELAVFYDLCDELGLAVLQDSEFNWTHPVEPAWADRMVAIYSETVLMLEDHPSVLSWICLNEPGVVDGSDESAMTVETANPATRGPAMTVSPGPQLMDAIRRIDPSRPIIKGSFCFDDPDSGDSHNYIGSLWEADVPYTDIDGTTEKLNTEFGFDAPGSWLNLRQVPRIRQRMSTIGSTYCDAQEYQYRLVKYFIEHYRCQRRQPNAGYVQFMFIDLSPQSFYGLYDWWGHPKRSLEAVRESNGPVAVMIRQTRDRAESVVVVNDRRVPLGEVRVRWSVSDRAGTILSEGDQRIVVGADSLVTVHDLAIDAQPDVGARLAVELADGSTVVNRYVGLFDHPTHVAGHPHRVSNELGMRLYTA